MRVMSDEMMEKDKMMLGMRNQIDILTAENFQVKRKLNKF